MQVPEGGAARVVRARGGPLPLSLREQLVRVHRAALRAVDAGEAVRRHLRREGDRLRVGGRRVPLGRRNLVLGAGKAAAAMAEAVEAILGDRLDGGLVVVKRGHALPLRRVAVREAGHPVPDEAGLAAALEVEALARSAGPDDLVIVVLSGGGSALLPAPVDGDLAGLVALTERLLRGGDDIRRINEVRRRADRLKGGGLARAIAPARHVTLALSDVLGDDPATIASGPTVPPGGPVAPYVVVGSLPAALDAAAREARALGWPTERVEPLLVGEARDEGARLGRLLREHPGPRCFVGGGEPVVHVRGAGRGGRAQELALAAAVELAGTDRLLLAAGTDGTDGPTDAAGAVVDGGTLARAGADPVDHLDRNDSGTFLARSGDLLITGPTRSNVGDLVLGLIPRRPRGPGLSPR